MEALSSTRTRARQVTRVDVANGDADGLCAVRQWRLHTSLPAPLITGLKRDIELLHRVKKAQEVLVCDVSMRRNRAALDHLLANGSDVHWFDHHDSGTVPRNTHLHVHIDTSPNTCSALLMDRYLQGRFRAWALVGAYGDQLTEVADRLGAAAGYSVAQLAVLRRVGLAINYNAYGDHISDVCIPPGELFERLARHETPWRLLDEEPVLREIEACRRQDFRQAMAVKPLHEDSRARVVSLPNTAWSRRVCGTLANALAVVHPHQAQVVMLAHNEGHFRVSLRSPRCTPYGAHTLCQRFGGDGRQAAAGIDALPADVLPRFLHAVSEATWVAPS